MKLTVKFFGYFSKKTANLFKCIFKIILIAIWSFLLWCRILRGHTNDFWCTYKQCSAKHKFVCHCDEMINNITLENLAIFHLSRYSKLNPKKKNFCLNSHTKLNPSLAKKFSISKGPLQFFLKIRFRALMIMG